MRRLASGSKDRAYKVELATSPRTAGTLAGIWALAKTLFRLYGLVAGLEQTRNIEPIGRIVHCGVPGCLDCAADRRAFSSCSTSQLINQQWLERIMRSQPRYAALCNLGGFKWTVAVEVVSGADRCEKHIPDYADPIYASSVRG